MSEQHSQAELDHGPHVPQAGAIPYRRNADGSIDVVLVTASSGGWTIPKGLIDPGMTAPRMAEVESLEEAGVIGTCEEPSIGSFVYDKWNKTCHVEVFAMPVERELESWAEQDERERRWVPVLDAIDEVRLPQMGEVVALFAKREGLAVPDLD